MLSIKKTVIKLIFRELRVGIMIGLTCGVLITLIAYIWRGPIIGIVVGISLLLTLIIGTLAGTIIPYFYIASELIRQWHQVHSSLRLMMFFSLFIYFGTATLFLSYML